MNDLFNQRGPRPANETYYFQLVPNVLIIQNPSVARNAKVSNAQFRLKMIKGSQLCDEMKKSIAVKAINGKAAFDKVKLNFNLPSFNPSRNIQFILILLKTQEGEEEGQVGRYSIMSSEFILEFKNNRTKVFQSNVNMSADYTLSFQLFVDNSRFALEKLIKDRKDEIKEEKIQNMLDITKKGNNVENPLSLNQAKSERISDAERFQVVMPGEDRFMSPTRRIVRKQSQTRKLLKRQNSPQEIQKSEKSESNSKRQLKFLSRNSAKQSSPRIQKVLSLAEQQSKNLTQQLRQQEQRQKQERLRKQKEAEAQKKRIQAQRAAQQRRVQSQRRREQQTAERKAAEEKRKRDQQLQLKLQLDREQSAKKLIQIKRQQSQRKRQQQQIRKAEQQERKRLEAERIANENERQRQRQRKLQQSRKARTKFVNEVKQPQQLIQNIQIGRAKPEPAKRPETDRNRLKKKESIQSAQDQAKTVFNSKQPAMTVRIRGQTPSQSAKYTFTTSPIVTKDEWTKPISFKKTGSVLFDNKGNQIKQTKTVEKGSSSQQMDIKTKIMLIAFFIIAILLFSSMMTPSKRRR